MPVPTVRKPHWAAPRSRRSIEIFEVELEADESEPAPSFGVTRCRARSSGSAAGSEAEAAVGEVERRGTDEPAMSRSRPARRARRRRAAVLAEGARGRDGRGHVPWHCSARGLTPDAARRRRRVLADLDGVVYAGANAIPRAVESLNLVKVDRAVGYITNNASRSDASVAASPGRARSRRRAAPMS